MSENKAKFAKLYSRYDDGYTYIEIITPYRIRFNIFSNLDDFLNKKRYC